MAIQSLELKEKISKLWFNSFDRDEEREELTSPLLFRENSDLSTDSVRKYAQPKEKHVLTRLLKQFALENSKSLNFGHNDGDSSKQQNSKIGEDRSHTLKQNEEKSNQLDLGALVSTVQAGYLKIAGPRVPRMSVDLGIGLIFNPNATNGKPLKVGDMVSTHTTIDRQKKDTKKRVQADSLAFDKVKNDILEIGKMNHSDFNDVLYPVQEQTNRESDGDAQSRITFQAPVTRRRSTKLGQRAEPGAIDAQSPEQKHLEEEPVGAQGNFDDTNMTIVNASRSMSVDSQDKPKLRQEKGPKVAKQPSRTSLTNSRKDSQSISVRQKSNEKPKVTVAKGDKPAKASSPTSRHSVIVRSKGQRVSPNKSRVSIAATFQQPVSTLGRQQTSESKQKPKRKVIPKPQSVADLDKAAKPSVKPYSGQQPIHDVRSLNVLEGIAEVKEESQTYLVNKPPNKASIPRQVAEPEPEWNLDSNSDRNHIDHSHLFSGAMSVSIDHQPLPRIDQGPNESSYDLKLEADNMLLIQRSMPPQEDESPLIEEHPETKKISPRSAGLVPKHRKGHSTDTHDDGKGPGSRATHYPENFVFERGAKPELKTVKLTLRNRKMDQQVASQSLARFDFAELQKDSESINMYHPDPYYKTSPSAFHSHSPKKSEESTSKRSSPFSKHSPKLKLELKEVRMPVVTLAHGHLEGNKRVVPETMTSKAGIEKEVRKELMAHIHAKEGFNFRISSLSADKRGSQEKHLSAVKSTASSVKKESQAETEYKALSQLKFVLQTSPSQNPVLLKHLETIQHVRTPDLLKLTESIIFQSQGGKNRPPYLFRSDQKKSLNKSLNLPFSTPSKVKRPQIGDTERLKTAELALFDDLEDPRGINPGQGQPRASTSLQAYRGYCLTSTSPGLWAIQPEKSDKKNRIRQPTESMLRRVKQIAATHSRPSTSLNADRHRENSDLVIDLAVAEARLPGGPLAGTGKSSPEKAVGGRNTFAQALSTLLRPSPLT